jgi:MFS family permease
VNNNRGQFYLFTKRRFLPFFITQFLGALNDNLFKNALLVIVVSTAITAADSNTNFITNLAAGLFILPFFLFSTLAGHLADRFDKAYLIRRIKFAEIILMLIGCLFFMAGQYKPDARSVIFIRNTIGIFWADKICHYSTAC